VQISILLPTYQRPHQLRDALASLAAQDRGLILEILVGDDAPARFGAENQAVIAQSDVAPLVRYIPNDPPLGPNQWGLGAHARGDYVVILHDDDRLCPGGLDKLVQACQAENDPMVKVWFGQLLVMSEEGVVDAEESRRVGGFYGRGGTGCVKPVWEWCLTQSLPPDCTLFARATYMAVGHGPRDGNVGDWALAVRLANSGAKGRYIAEDVSCYRLNAVSVTSAGRGMDVHYSYEVAEQLQVPPQRLPEKQQLVQRFAEVATTRYLRDGERLRAWKCFLSSHWRWTRRLSARGVATLLMLMTPAPCWRWAMRHRS